MAPSIKLPTRIITYAWGATYVEELLTLTIPALLAPGNLPYVASQVSCEVIILTEEHLFEKVSSDPAVMRVRGHCPVRLLGLDDLITASDNKYGMALTYALHRGFSDLGPAMTDCWLIFLNADFLLADGSLRNLLPHLMRGERIVASPSYCVVKKDVLPELYEWLDTSSSTLSIPPREMAKLALRHRHNTIRGKTVNQRAFHIQYMEQFYWLVDGDTLLGHQMPVAIVGMRPQAHVTEPSAYWDHGLMLEFCPTAEVKVLGDSDEFLMIELRDKDVAQDQLSTGWPDTRELVERIFVSMTAYQRDFVHLPLTLHAGELPPQTEVARQELRAFVGRWLSHLPKHLPSHLHHPQWDYHFPAFTEARHQYLSTRLGHRTRTMPPPDTFSEIDKCWWRLDGLQKTLSHRRDVLAKMMNRQVQLLHESIDRNLARQDEAFVEEMGLMTFGEPNDDVEGFARAALSQTSPAGSGQPQATAVALNLVSVFSRYENRYSAIREEAEKKNLAAMVEAVRRYHLRRVQALEAEFKQPIAELKESYDRLIAKRVSTAATPFVKLRAGSDATASSAGGAPSLKAHAARVYRKVFGKWPHVTVLNPLWAPIHPFRRALERALAAGPNDVLFVGDRTGLANGLVTLSGQHAWVTTEGLTSGNFAKAFDRPPQFDLCICDLDLADALRFNEIVAVMRPFMREGGTILGFYLNAGAQPAQVHQLDFSRVGARISYAGSTASAKVLAAHAATFYRGRMSNALYGSRIAARLALLTPRTLLANLTQALVREAEQSTPPSQCTGVTLEVSFPWFEGDDGTVEFAKRAGVYVTGVEAPTFPERRVGPNVANPPGTVVILAFGQSNAANEGAGAYVARQKVHVFNIFDMNYYLAVDPLPGASGSSGSVWGRLGDRLIESGRYKSVLFVPIAFGASYIKDWAPGGQCHRRLQLALRRLTRAGVRVDMMCWQQGEADANHTDMPAQEYKSQFLRMVKAIRNAGVQAPIYVAVTSLCENAAHPYENREQIRLAQKQLVSAGDRLLPGPDTDCFDGEHRRDGCHFSESGLDLCAQAWLESLTSDVDLAQAPAGRR